MGLRRLGIGPDGPLAPEGKESMRVGCAYHPEQRDHSFWKQDARWMSEAGFTVARIGDFAWRRMEPEQDRFDFAWLTDAVGILASFGVQSIIATPTAGPPSWLVGFDDPADDARQVYEDVGRWDFGGRNMLCVNHPAMSIAAGGSPPRSAAVSGAHPRCSGFRWTTSRECTACAATVPDA